jgi:hypothetical protein
MLEFITLLSSLILIGISLDSYRSKEVAYRVSYVFWAVSGLAFLIISIALIVLGLNALQLPVTPYLGSIYPAFMALGLVAYRSRYWKHYLAFVILMLILIPAGSAFAVNVFQVGLHSISGLIIILLPVVYFVRKQANAGILLFTVGGFTIAVGGMALAAISAGKPILPLELVVQLLHPLLFISAFLLASGIYTVKNG